MKDKTTVELRGRRSAINEAQSRALEEAGPNLDFAKATSLGGADAADNLHRFRALEEEANAIGAELTDRDFAESVKGRIAGDSKLVDHPGHATIGRDAATKPKMSPGEAFISSEQYKRFDPSQMGQQAGITIDGLNFRAATFDTPTSALTEYDRQPPMVLLGQQRLLVANLFAQGQTGMNTIRYVQETSYTNAATTVAEGATKPEATWATGEVDAPVRKIAVTSKVTDELFSDFPAMASYIDNRMRFMVGQTEETQLLSGNGTAPNLRGVLNVVGIQTQPKGADNGPDAIMKAIVKVQAVGFFEPDAVVQHPTDWQNIRLLKDANGNYIFGQPGIQATRQIWGYPVVVTTAITVGTSLVGAFQLGGQIFYRDGLRVESANQNEDDFKTNKIAIRAEQREALAIYRPKAFCTVTGL